MFLISILLVINSFCSRTPSCHFPSILSILPSHVFSSLLQPPSQVLRHGAAYSTEVLAILKVPVLRTVRYGIFEIPPKVSGAVSCHCFTTLMRTLLFSAATRQHPLQQERTNPNNNKSTRGMKNKQTWKILHVTWPWLDWVR